METQTKQTSDDTDLQRLAERVVTRRREEAADHAADALRKLAYALAAEGNTRDEIECYRMAAVADRWCSAA